MCSFLYRSPPVFSIIIGVLFSSLCYAQLNAQSRRLQFKAENEAGTTSVYEFNNIAVEQKENGLVYVGARNRLYQLDSNLRKVLPSIVTGPVANDIVCECKRNGLTDNVNKLLIIDSSHDRVIVCGSVEQGVCEIREEGNLENVLSNADISQTASRHHVAAGGYLSTVGFTARVRSGQEYLYVGSSKTYEDERSLKDTMESSFYTIAKRWFPVDNNNPDIFSVNQLTDGSYGDVGIKMSDRNYAEEGFRVTFIDGFVTNLTGYFVTTHPSPLQSPPYNNNLGTTFLGQFCLEDKSPDVSSYLELPLECSLNGIVYTRAVASRTAKVGSLLQQDLGLNFPGSSSDPTDVVFVSFIQPNSQSTGSAVCLFPLYEIERRFVQLTKRCQRNSLEPQPDRISWILQTSGNNKCGFGQFDVTSPVCRNEGMWDVARHLQGRIFSKNAVFATDDTIITAMEITHNKDMDRTVALFGTKNGKMLKISLDSSIMDSSSNVEYETVMINEQSDEQIFKQPNEKNPSLVKFIRLSYSENVESQRIYTMTPAVVVSLPLFNCSQYKDCASCLGSKDPFCGWCTLEGRCSSPGDCDFSNSARSHRFIKSGGECPRLSSNTPLVLEASQSQKRITLIGHNVPLDMRQRTNYHCYFGDLDSHPVTNLKAGDPATIRCVSPPSYSIPSFSPGQGSLVVPLSLVYMSSSGKIEIAKTDFTFYKCSVYTSCMSCVSTAFNCSWCLYENTCTHQSNTYCPQTDVKASKSCPQLTALEQGNAIYLPEGQNRDLILPVLNLPDRWKSFQCRLIIEDGQTSLATGTRGADGRSINCANIRGSLPSNMRSANALIRVTAASPRSQEIDNPSQLKVEIYRCDTGNAGSCGVCLQSPAAWKCGWCETSKRCTLQTECSDWLEASENTQCKNPVITKFTPATAPFGQDSNTQVKLEGVNFGADKKMYILVAGVKCEVVNSTCCNAVCIPKARSVVSGPITLCISDTGYGCSGGDEYSTTTDEAFRFVDPHVSSFEPRAGLDGWGTLIAVKGKNLDTGNSIEVVVAGRECKVEHKTNSRLLCRLACTSSDERRRRNVMSSSLSIPRPRRSFSDLTATFDGVLRLSEKGSFDFVDEVSITSVQPITTIRSGGLPLLVTGTNLNLIQNPRIKVTLAETGEEYISVCKKGSGNTLECQSPSIASSSIFNYDSERRTEARVQIVNAACAHRSVSNAVNLIYDRDPRLDTFDGPDNTKIFRDEPIYITGTKLCPDHANCNSSIVNVFIGVHMICNVTRLDMDQITCVPPVADLGSYTVEVWIGGYSQEIGSLEYTKQMQFPPHLVIVILVIAALVVVAILLLVFKYRRRAKATDQQLKDVQRQMIHMESKVANICKEAFAELQTDMCELDTFAGGAGIPYLPYRIYLMRVLFPDPVTSHRLHSVLLSHNIERNDSRSSSRGMGPRTLISLDRFDQLLENKIFLLSFIKALEMQRSFSMKDRSQVAGLVLIVLHNRLQYATEILEHLLAELIRKNMESRKPPQLLLRSTESVAEKMLTHWFSILLHSFVMECAGEPFFTLYRAIKQQVDKGPLDACTNEARNSLSEDKLLRQSVDHDKIILRVTNKIAGYELPEFSVKVLSCDSISQVKRKILDFCYMNVHYSSRPHPEDTDLELRLDRPNDGCILKDEDSSSLMEGDWKQINTLDHYKVKSNDRVALIPRQDPPPHNLSIITVASKASSHKHNGSGGWIFQPNDSNSSLPRIRPQPSRSATPTLHSNNTKLWHLVKPSDHEKKEGTIKGDNKMVSEIYLTRLLTTKGTIQKYVDDLFETVFSVFQRGHTLPLAVKHMFDFLDHQAEIYGITQPDIVHTWKSNCLPLRFWVNLIKNPEFIYDVHKSPIVDCYLSVIAQAFMDSCSTAEYKLGKDSPSNKLLYAKDIPEYKEWVSGYYYKISGMPNVNPRDFSTLLKEESNMHAHEFNRQGALNELYNYVQRYSDEILNVLDSNLEARRQRLTKQFGDVCMSMNGAAAV